MANNGQVHNCWPPPRQQAMNILRSNASTRLGPTSATEDRSCGRSLPPALAALVLVAPVVAPVVAAVEAVCRRTNVDAARLWGTGRRTRQNTRFFSGAVPPPIGLCRWASGPTTHATRWTVTQSLPRAHRFGTRGRTRSWCQGGVWWWRWWR